MASPKGPSGEAAARSAQAQAHAVGGQGRRRSGRWSAIGARLVVAVLAPVLLLGGAEALLRLLGFGYPVGFFLAQDQVRWTTNARFGWRFFPRELARSPVVLEIPRPKPPDTLRVLVLGGSAAMGTPDSSYGLPRQLEVVLAAVVPAPTRVEVVNAAMTAINSHVVRQIAADCMVTAPDVVVVYMGNNEVVGPFGPGTVFHGLTRSAGLVRLSLWLKGLRVGQLIDGAVAGIGGAGPATWRGMEMFVNHRTPADDPRLVGVAESFESNLEAILDTARRTGARVVLSTVATNLTDSPPFGSAHGAGLSPAELEQWRRDYEHGERLLAAGQASEAVAAFERALAADDRYADLRFRLGQAFAAIGRTEESHRHFVAARDLDVLRFRADSTLNTVIRKVAERWSQRGVGLVDAEALIGDGPEADDGALFFEHVHLRFRGTLVLARLLAPAVREAAGLGPPPAPVELPAAEQVAERLGYSACESFRLEREMHGMMMRPPFTGQLDHEQSSARRAAALAEAWAGVAGREDACIAWQASVVERDPDDDDLRRNLAALLTRSGRPAEAATHWRKLTARLPEVAEWRTELGFALIDEGRRDEGLEEIRAVVRTAPDQAGAYANLGYALRGRGDLEGAEAAYRKALRRRPRLGEAWTGLATVELARGHRDRARELYEEALAHDPGFAEAANALGFLDQEDGRLDSAEHHYRNAIAVAPQLAPAWNNLGHLLEQRGRFEEAERSYRGALVADPTHGLAAFNLGDLLLGSGRPAAAVAAYRLGLLGDPANHQGRLNLALALQSCGLEGDAVAVLREALERNPSSTEAMMALAEILATAGSAKVRNPGEALELLLRVEQVRGGDEWRLLEVRARALAAAGRSGQARTVLEQALSAAREAGRDDAAARIAALLGHRSEADGR